MYYVLCSADWNSSVYGNYNVIRPFITAMSILSFITHVLYMHSNDDFAYSHSTYNLLTLPWDHIITILLQLLQYRQRSGT